jgi:transposase
MPRPPKAKRKKTDKIDTKRLLRECIHNTLPVAYRPAKQIRQLRRLTTYRESLMARRTALRNWIDRFLAHETWRSRKGLWSAAGMARLKEFAATLGASDQIVLGGKIEELEQLAVRLKAVVGEIERISSASTAARRLDAIYGIGPISAVSILARIASAGRFDDAESLIGYAGLAPSVHRSDQTSWSGHIGGPGTDARLRHYLVEASVWARKIPRYEATYERVRRKRGAKVGRLVVSRLLLRSIFKMLRDGVEFQPNRAA